MNWKTTYSPHELETVACLLCGETNASPVAEELSLTIVACQQCQLIYVKTRLPESEKNYWNVSREQVVAKYARIFSGAIPHDRDGLYRSHLRAIARYKPAGRFLDVGTHCGFFLRHTIGTLWEAEGVEPSAVLGQLARDMFGLRVQIRSLHDAHIASNTFDVVTLLDVIEHVQRPNELVDEIYRITQPDGIFFVKTPNGTYNRFKHFVFHTLLNRKDCDCFDAREHVAAYTGKTLGKLLSSHGWVIVEIQPSAPVQTYGSGMAKKAARNLLYAISLIWNRLFGGAGPVATDLIAIARKPSG